MNKNDRILNIMDNIKAIYEEEEDAEQRELEIVISNLNNLLDLLEKASGIYINNSKMLRVEDKNNLEKSKTEDKEDLLAQKESRVFRDALWGSLNSFPRRERNGLIAIIKNNLIAFESNLELGRRMPSMRLKKYQEAQYNLEAINSALKLSVRQRYIGRKFYRHIFSYYSALTKTLDNLIESSTRKEITQ